jgi:hypothetical protein
MKRILTGMFFVVLLSACTTKNYAEDDGLLRECVIFSTGEKFNFYPNTATLIVSFNQIKKLFVVDTTGRTRELSSYMRNNDIKCTINKGV